MNVVIQSCTYIYMEISVTSVFMRIKEPPLLGYDCRLDMFPYAYIVSLEAI